MGQYRALDANPKPLRRLRTTEIRKTEMKYFTPGQVSTFLQTAKTDKHYLVFLLAFETGMRPEEYLAVQWKDVDLESGVLSVRRALVWNRKGGGFRFEEPKTTKSRRTIPLSNSVVSALKVYRRTQLEQRMKLGSDYANLDLVFATELGTPISSKNLRDRHFRPLMTKAALPEIRLYDLRHTTATLLLSAGENPKVVSERLRHASIVLTLDTYSHVLPSMQKEAPGSTRLSASVATADIFMLVILLFPLFLFLVIRQKKPAGKFRISDLSLALKLKSF